MKPTVSSKQMCCYFLSRDAKLQSLIQLLLKFSAYFPGQGKERKLSSKSQAQHTKRRGNAQVRARTHFLNKWHLS